MGVYTVEIRRGDRVINVIADKEFSDQSEAWRFVDELSHHYDSPGLKVVIRDQDGGVFLMAGITTLHLARKKQTPRRAVNDKLKY